MLDLIRLGFRLFLLIDVVIKIKISRVMTEEYELCIMYTSTQYSI